MPGPAIPRYRAAFAYAAGYTAVFLVVAVLRLSAEGPFPPPHLAALIPGLALVYGAGGVFALPLIWTLRRFRRSRKVPILLWWAAVPFSALGAVFGGLLGPPGILLLGGAPIVAALGVAFVVQAIWVRARPRPESPGGAAEPASGLEPPTC